MSTRLEVQSAIEQLPEREIRDLSKWLQEYLEQKWDLFLLDRQLRPIDIIFIPRVDRQIHLHSNQLVE
jgi:hypothetical protein